MFRGKFTILILLLLSTLFVSCDSDDAILDEELFVPTEFSYETKSLEIGNYIDESTSQTDIVFAHDRELYYDGHAYFSEFFVRADQMVKKGDRLASFYTENSAVPLEEKQIELRREQDSITSLTQSYNTQYRINSEILGTLTAGTEDYTIQLLSMEKERFSYEQNIFVTQNNIDRLTEEIAEIREEMDTQYLLAPFDGMIVMTGFLEAGDLVDPTRIVVGMVDIQNLLLKIKNPKGFRYGDSVDIEVRYGREELFLTGKVISSPVILPQEYREESYYVRIDGIENLTDTIIEAYNSFAVFVEVTSVSEYIPDTLLLDKSLATNEADKKYVNILEDGVVKKRYFTSIFDNKDYYAVIDGLTEGQEILVE